MQRTALPIAFTTGIPLSQSQAYSLSAGPHKTTCKYSYHVAVPTRRDFDHLSLNGTQRRFSALSRQSWLALDCPLFLLETTNSPR